MLHLSDVAVHVDTCLPQPFLHCVISVCRNDQYSVVLYVGLSFKAPPPSPRPPAPPLLFHLCSSSIYLDLTLLHSTQANYDTRVTFSSVALPSGLNCDSTNASFSAFHSSV